VSIKLISRHRVGAHRIFRGVLPWRPLVGWVFAVSNGGKDIVLLARHMPSEPNSTSRLSASLMAAYGPLMGRRDLVKVLDSTAHKRSTARCSEATCPQAFSH
jgi:hypothetical protein